jgi:hypothetical protein
VDGPRVTVDYYADTIGGNYFGLQGGKFNFVKVSSIHYSLNGKEKLVAQKGSYVMSDDTTVAETLETGFKHTGMSILAGANASTSATNYGKALNNNVTTAWKASDSSLSSDILSLNGMARTLGSIYTDQYVISMTYTTGTISDTLINAGLFGILTRNGQNGWINAVNKNLVGIPTHFVLGPWNSSYPLGTYGVDTAAHTAWAVLNYNGDFAVGSVSLYLPIVLK